MRLSELRTGDKGVIVKVMGRGAFRKRIIEMGFIRGKEVIVIQNAPLKDPIHYRVMGYDVSLRRSDAALIEVVSAADFEKEQATSVQETNRSADSFILPWSVIRTAERPLSSISRPEHMSMWVTIAA